MSKAAQRRLQAQRDRRMVSASKTANAASVDVVVRRPGKAAWAVAVRYADGEVQVDGFETETEARRMVAIVLPELQGPNPGVQAIALQDCSTGQVMQRWEVGDA